MSGSMHRVINMMSQATNQNFGERLKISLPCPVVRKEQCLRTVYWMSLDDIDESFPE
jgi:hypothetical protein